MYKRIISAALSALLVTGTAACFSGCESSGGNTFKTADKVEDGTILQAFSWDFKTIKASLPDIAAAGFSAVQTSPINECLEGEDGGMQLYGNGKWYYHYQPTDFKIGNYQLGTRDEFKELCEEADKYGIKIIVDIIANHTTPQLDAVSKDLIEAGGGSFDTLFHKNNSKDIKDYSDRLMCTTAKMGGLPDINTERPSFQEYFISFVNDCIACGADGFRYDTAKHIGLPDDPKEDDGFENNFWKRVTKDIDKADDMFIYGEVLQGNNDRIADYIKEIGRTTSSSYGSKLRAALMNNIVDTSSVKEYWLGNAPLNMVTGNAPLNMVTWVESHDNYINDGTAFDLTNEQIVLGWSIITARKDGTPLFFSRPYNCSMQNIWGMNRIGAQGDDIYKSSTVSAVNFFRTAMIGEEENLVNPNKDSTILMIERGKKGTSLADGKYVDRVDGKTEYTVKDGKLSCDSKIKGNSVVVLYNDGFTAHDAPANAGVAKDTVFTFEKDSMDVTLTLENADEGQYTISGGESKSFKDGDKVTLTPTDGGATILELTAENKSGLKTYEKLAFYKPEVFEVKKGEKIYFEKPSDWDDEINVYIYNESGEEIGDWPGTAMTKEADGKYSYTFEKDWSSPLVIFNDGDKIDSVQYPAERGLKAEKDKTYNVE